MSRSFGALIAVAALLSWGNAFSGNPENPKPVVVTNPSLPVTGSVDATVSNTVDVKIVNVPLIELLNTREPFQTRFITSYSPPAITWRAESAPIPEGTRLTVEFLTINYPTATSVSELGSCNVWVLQEAGCDSGLADKIVMQHRVPTTSSRERGEQDDFLQTSAALPMRLYLDAGQTMCVLCPLPEDNNLLAGGGGQVSVAGYLEIVE